MTTKNPRNAERIFPYLGGEEVNTDPQHAHRRWCIDFNDFPLRREPELKPWSMMDDRERATCRRIGVVPSDYADPVAADWPDLLEIVERLVKPERLRRATGKAKTLWWQFERPRPHLRAALFGVDSVITITQTSPFLSAALMSSDKVFDQKLIVVVSTEQVNFGCIQSRVHELWARSFSGTMKDDLSYNPTDCFGTFAFAPISESLLGVTKSYLSTRSDLLASLEIGLTEANNRFHDPDEEAPNITRLRDLHHEMDQAVLRAYDWDDLAGAAEPEFLTEDNEPDHRYQGRLFWPAPFRDEVLARLLDLNATRAAAERARGLVPTAVDEMEGV